MNHPKQAREFWLYIAEPYDSHVFDKPDGVSIHVIEYSALETLNVTISKLDEDVRFYRNEWESACERYNYANQEREEVKVANESLVSTIDQLTQKLADSVSKNAYLQQNYAEAKDNQKILEKRLADSVAECARLREEMQTVHMERSEMRMQADRDAERADKNAAELAAEREEIKSLQRHIELLDMKCPPYDKIVEERDSAIAERDELKVKLFESRKAHDATSEDRDNLDGANIRMNHELTNTRFAHDAALAKAQAMQEALEKIANIKIFSHDVREDLVISIASKTLAKWRGKENE